MARELERQAITEILAASGHLSSATRVLRAAELAQRLSATAEIRELIQAVCASLGGSPKTPDSPGPWDIVAAGFIVEVDEAQHFNRYRAITLNCPLYEKLPEFPLLDYRRFCGQFETECVRKACGGKYWTSESTERQFGASDPPRVFGERGSARWKQRAFYDMLKDMSPLVGSLPVARISIWDTMPIVKTTVANALANRSPQTDNAILALILARAGVQS